MRLSKKVFLGGTCNDSIWRDELIKMLKVSYFNPVVEDWDEKAQEREFIERENCKFVLYVITPLMAGVYSIAEAVEDAIKRPKKCLFCILEEDDGKKFDKGQMKSLKMVEKMISGNGATVFQSLEEIADFLNKWDFGKHMPSLHRFVFSLNSFTNMMPFRIFTFFVPTTIVPQINKLIILQTFI